MRNQIQPLLCLRFPFISNSFRRHHTHQGDHRVPECGCMDGARMYGSLRLSGSRHNTHSTYNLDAIWSGCRPLNGAIRICCQLLRECLAARGPGPPRARSTAQHQHIWEANTYAMSPRFDILTRMSHKGEQVCVCDFESIMAHSRKGWASRLQCYPQRPEVTSERAFCIYLFTHLWSEFIGMIFHIYLFIFILHIFYYVFFCIWARYFDDFFTRFYYYCYLIFFIYR